VIEIILSGLFLGPTVRGANSQEYRCGFGRFICKTQKQFPEFSFYTFKEHEAANDQQETIILDLSDEGDNGDDGKHAQDCRCRACSPRKPPPCVPVWPVGVRSLFLTKSEASYRLPHTTKRKHTEQGFGEPTPSPTKRHCSLPVASSVTLGAVKNPPKREKKSRDSTMPDAQKTAGHPRHSEGGTLNRQSTAGLNKSKTKTVAICDRQELRRLFQHYNQKIFANRLPNNLSIEWTEKLYTTAGIFQPMSNEACRILLSIKVVDTTRKVRETLVHEMCHAAVWLLDKDYEEIHGRRWKGWAQRALRLCDELKEVRQRVHNYPIRYPCGYRCSQCGTSFGCRKAQSFEYRCSLCADDAALTFHFGPVTTHFWLRSAIRLCAQ